MLTQKGAQIRKFGLCFILSAWILLSIVSCSCGDGDSSDDSVSAPSDDSSDDSSSDDVSDDTHSDDASDDSADDADDSADDTLDDDSVCVPYWTEGTDFGPAEVMTSGDQGLNAWETEAAEAARDALLTSGAVHWVATYLQDDDEYILWHAGGELRFTRTISDDGYVYTIVDQSGTDPFPNTDPMYAPDLETEISLYENPNDVDMQSYGYAADDPRVGFLPVQNSSYPEPFARISQAFDTPNAPDLLFGYYNVTTGGPGSHGALSLSQSRAALVFSGPGVRHGEILAQAAHQTDIAPTVLALLGADLTEGVDHRGHTADNVFLAWQDGRVLDGIMEDPCAPKPMAEYAVIIELDGLNSNELIWNYENVGSGGHSLPNMFELMSSGVIYRGGALVGLPSYSFPGHTSVGTGTLNGHHGVTNNSIYLRDTKSIVSMDWLFDHIDEVIADPQAVEDYFALFYHADRVETIFQAAHRSFGDWTLWPPAWDKPYLASVNELYFLGADYSVLELLKLIDGILSARASASIDFATLMQIADALAPVEVQMIFSDPTHDYPKITTVGFYNSDHQGEGYGPHSDALRIALEQIDRSIGIIIDAYKEAGIFDKTVWVITSDHGMELQDVTRSDTFQPALDASGVKYVMPMSASDLYLLVLRAVPSAESLPAGVASDLTVLVTDDDTGQNVEGALVTLTGGSCAPCSATSGADGTAVINVTPTSGAPLDLSVTHSDFTPFFRTIEVE